MCIWYIPSRINTSQNIFIRVWGYFFSQIRYLQPNQISDSATDIAEAEKSWFHSAFIRVFSDIPKPSCQPFKASSWQIRVLQLFTVNAQQPFHSWIWNGGSKMEEFCGSLPCKPISTTDLPPAVQLAGEKALNPSVGLSPHYKVGRRNGGFCWFSHANWSAQWVCSTADWFIWGKTFNFFLFGFSPFWNRGVKQKSSMTFSHANQSAE